MSVTLMNIIRVGNEHYAHRSNPAQPVPPEYHLYMTLRHPHVFTLLSPELQHIIDTTMLEEDSFVGYALFAQVARAHGETPLGFVKSHHKDVHMETVAFHSEPTQVLVAEFKGATRYADISTPRKYEKAARYIIHRLWTDRELLEMKDRFPDVDLIRMNVSNSGGHTKYTFTKYKKERKIVLEALNTRFKKAHIMANH